MRKLPVLFALLLVILNLSCHNNNGLSKSRKTIITGKVANMQVYPDYNKFTLTVADFGGSPTTYSGKINKDGSFKISFDQYIAEDVKIDPIVGTFIAHPGDSIYIDVDYKSIGDITFSGDAEKTNTDLRKYIEGYYAQYDLNYLHKYIFALDISNYIAVCENIRVEMLKNRAAFITEFRPNDEVNEWTKSYVVNTYYTSLLTMLPMRQYFYQLNKMQPSKILQSKGFPNPGGGKAMPSQITLSKEFANFESDINEIYKANTLNSGAYKMLPLLLLYLNKSDFRGKPQDEILKERINQVSKNNKNEKLKQLLVGELFYQMLKQDDKDDFDTGRKLFESNLNMPFIKQPLLKYYSEVNKNLQNPQIASNAILSDLSKTPVNNILDTIRNQNKGKVIYVDFWATWCAPCKAEIPYSKKLMETYKGKDVVFAFICIASKKDVWEFNLSKLQLSGNQFFCDQKQSAGIRQRLKINAIPYYMMINKKGDITESGIGPRPDNPLTQRKINKLLFD